MSEGSIDRTLTQTDDDQRRARERSLQPTRPPLIVPGYRAERFLGAGAYGQVWVAVDTNTGRRVAIKFYLHRGGLDWTILTREVERLALLFADRYVVQLIEVGWDSDPPYFVMEYLERGSLADRLNTGPIEVAEAVELFRDVAIGLVHAQGKGVLHCDLKPANVLLDQDGHPRLADFGQSRLSDEQSPSLGTLFYMAPEQADLKAAPDARWDVYALGALLYAMITGSPPYRSTEALAHIQQVGGLEEQLARYRQWIEQSPRPIGHRHLAGVDRALSDILHRCLSVDPHKRYANPQAVLDALHARSARKARRPLLVLGFVGPMVLLLIVSLFAYNLFETSLGESRDALTHRALESDRFAAQFVAENVAREINERWQTLEHVAGDDDFREAVLAASRGGGDSPAARELQVRLARLDQQLKLADSDSWYVIDHEGIQLARNPPVESTIGVNYAFRDYYHGQGLDLARDARPGPLRNPHLSIVFTSEATDRRTVSLSVPIFSHDGGADADDVLGVLCHAVDLGHFAELRADERSGNNQTPVLIDCRNDETGRRGAILEHPGLRPLLKEPSAQDRLYLRDDILDRLARLRELRRRPHSDDADEAHQVNELARMDDYHDPIGGEFAGRWLAAAEPVEVISRRDMSSRDTGWVVIVQERYRAAVAPVQELRDRLLFQAKVATTVVAVALAGLWGFVILVLNESPRLRWFDRLRQQTSLSPHTHTPNSASLSGSLLSPAPSASPPPAADTARGEPKASDTAEHQSK
ncbi:MAG TPA: serine/threonine protein kinase [Pirellulales bacterium]|nr:serine/threonine protein kinase [Pirellulales bacterium]